MENNTIHFICEKEKDHFAQTILDKMDVKVIKRMGSNDLSHFVNSIGAKTIWVEWASHPAIILSRFKRPWQKLIIRLHRYEMYRKKWMRKINWSKVDYVIFVNSELELEFKKNINNSVKTITIPNAINVDTFNINIPNSANSLLAYGLHFDPIKAYSKLIILFAEIFKQNPNFTLTIAGQKPKHKIHQKEYDKCKKIVKKFRLEEKIHFKELEINKDELKSHSNIKTLLEKHNAIVSYSDMESFHYAFAEGLLSGLQGFCRGWRELNPNEFWSNWCYDNEQTMVEGILKWGESSCEERMKIAKFNRDYIINNFSTEKISKDFEKLLKGL